MSNFNRKIAKNSIVMYARLLVTTVIGLYVSRLALKELGVENYGLYAVIAGIVAMLNFLNISMVSTSNRFITVEISKKQDSNPNRIFNTLFLIHFIFTILFVIIIESIGVWYVKNILLLNGENIQTAVKVLRYSTLTVGLTTLSIPYQGLVTAYEKFNFKSIVEIIQSLLGLLAVLFLTLIEDEGKLVTYALLTLIVQIIIFGFYFIYTYLNYKSIVAWRINKKIDDYRSVTAFFGWQLVYVFGSIGSSQGGALVLNSFFGTIINASFGLAARVNDFIFSFVRNLNQVALPQIINAHVTGNNSRALSLIYNLPRITFFLMLIPSMPILLSIDFILAMWLDQVPPFTASFVFFRIIHGLISCLESGFDGTIDASGKIRLTKLVFTFLFLFDIPISYFLFSLGFKPYFLIIVIIISELLFWIFQMRILKIISEFSYKDYIRNTLIPILLVICLVLPQSLLNKYFDASLADIVAKSLLSFVLTIVPIYFIGLTNKERSKIANLIKTTF